MSKKSHRRRLPKAISEAIEGLLSHVAGLQALARDHAPNLKFTLDGRLVGDIGELIAATKLGITIQKRQQTGFDGVDKEGRNVEIKTTFKNSFAFRKITERVICIKLHGSTHWEIIYDGLGSRLIKLFAEDAYGGNAYGGDRYPRITRKKPASLKSQRQLSISKFPK